MFLNKEIKIKMPVTEERWNSIRAELGSLSGQENVTFAHYQSFDKAFFVIRPDGPLEVRMTISWSDKCSELSTDSYILGFIEDNRYEKRSYEGSTDVNHTFQFLLSYTLYPLAQRYDLCVIVGERFVSPDGTCVYTIKFETYRSCDPNVLMLGREMAMFIKEGLRGKLLDLQKKTATEAIKTVLSDLQNKDSFDIDALLSDVAAKIKTIKDHYTIHSNVHKPYLLTLDETISQINYPDDVFKK